jgi:glycosyltransferase involved in cell wall biosynthesis
MRWRALRAALGGAANCVAIRFGCDHQRQCRAVCAITGATPPNREAGEWWFTSGYCDNDISRLADELLSAGISTVVCSGLETHRHATALTSVPGLRVVYDMHNVEFPVFRSISQDSGVPDPHLHRIEQAERSAVTAVGDIWTCSDDDARLVARTYPEAGTRRIHTVPNVVPVPAPPRLPVPQPRRVCFTGHLWWYPNVAAVRTLVRDITPWLRAAGFVEPVVVAGLEPGDELVELCREGQVRLIADPPSTESLIRESVMVVPLTLGGGTRLKALEAFAQGAPLVSTAKGVEGLDVEAGVHYLRAESPDEFGSAVIRLVKDDQLRTRLVSRAWRLVRDRYSVEALRDRVGVALAGP